MNIVMMTNTYTPHVGGVARSVVAFSNEYRRRGHRVLIVAPEFSDMPKDEVDVVRIPAIQNFNGSDFSVVLPVSGLLSETLDAFRPDIVHAHHPYLLGMTAIRVARYREAPLLFTHHTLYEEYTHYVPGDSPALRRFVIELATHYGNLADHVFAPSESIASLLRQRGVIRPITVLPTGVDIVRFAHGDGDGFRTTAGIASDAYVVGHLGRLAPEKNLLFLAESVAAFLESEPRACFLVGGSGPSEAEIRSLFAARGLTDRLHMVGTLDGQQLVDAYHAMHVFAFASKSETQGMVLTEAMAAGLPVVALDASGVREVVQDGYNGRLLSGQSAEDFRVALASFAKMTAAEVRDLRDGALVTAKKFSIRQKAALALDCYAALLSRELVTRHEEIQRWERILDLIQAEWNIVKGVAESAGTALGGKASPLDEPS
jgi:glycosyltransferase involved in cell wall biosynthesis